MKQIIPLVLCVTVAFGQQTPPPPEGDMPNPPEPPQRERIEMMKMWKLTEVLELSEDQAQKFFPRYNSLVKELEGLVKQQKEQMDELREMVKKEKGIKEKEVDGMMKKIMDLEKQKLDKKQKFVEDLGNILTPEQKAKYIVFEVHFKEELRRKIRDRATRFKKDELPHRTMKKRLWR